MPDIKEGPNDPYPTPPPLRQRRQFVVTSPNYDVYLDQLPESKRTSHNDGYSHYVLSMDAYPSERYWSSKLKNMSDCTSFEELAQLCQSMSHDIPSLELTSFSNRRLNCDPVDEYADAWLPEDCRIRSPFPIRTKPDGSCFAHAASRLMFGTPNRHVEVRV